MTSKSVSCDNCGACCMEQRSPGDFLPTGGEEPWDAELYADLPAEAVAELAAYIDGPLPAIDGRPCIWLNLEAKRCRWYEYRPTICREFPVGSEGCLVWRERYGVTT